MSGAPSNRLAANGITVTQAGRYVNVLGVELTPAEAASCCGLTTDQLTSMGWLLDHHCDAHRLRELFTLRKNAP
jgi:hypothetical protein